MYQRPQHGGKLAKLLAITVQMALPFCATIDFWRNYFDIRGNWTFTLEGSTLCHERIGNHNANTQISFPKTDTKHLAGP